MNAPDGNDIIEKLLSEQDGHLADDGFTRRVVRQLPHRRRWLPRVFLLAVVVVGSLLAFYWLPWKTLPPLDYKQVLSLNSGVLSAWLPVVVVVGALVSAAVAALRRE